MKRLVLPTLASFLVLAACGGSEKKPEQPADTTGNTQAASTHQQSCEAMFAKARECTDEYIPMLVDLRISMDIPPGIAEAAQTEGRGELISKAKQEWAEDSKPENVSMHCKAMIGKTSDEDAAAMAKSLDACLAEESCSAYVGCLQPLHRQMFATAPHPDAKPAPAPESESE